MAIVPEIFNGLLFTMDPVNVSAKFDVREQKPIKNVCNSSHMRSHGILHIFRSRIHWAHRAVILRKHGLFVFLEVPVSAGFPALVSCLSLFHGLHCDALFLGVFRLDNISSNFEFVYFFKKGMLYSVERLGWFRMG